MGIKGVIRPDHMQQNKFALLSRELPTLTPLKITGIEEELDNVDLPDRTSASGGRTKQFEIVVTFALHHRLEIEALELWWTECEDPVSPLYKKDITLAIYSQSSIDDKSFLLEGMFPIKRGVSDLDLDNDGEMVTQDWTFKVDQLLEV